MPILRLLAVLVVVAVIGAIVLFLLTGQRSYLRFASRLFRYAVIFALVFFGLLALERVVRLVMS